MVGPLQEPRPISSLLWVARHGTGEAGRHHSWPLPVVACSQCPSPGPGCLHPRPLKQGWLGCPCTLPRLWSLPTHSHPAETALPYCVRSVLPYCVRSVYHLRLTVAWALPEVLCRWIQPKETPHPSQAGSSRWRGEPGPGKVSVEPGRTPPPSPAGCRWCGLCWGTMRRQGHAFGRRGLSCSVGEGGDRWTRSAFTCGLIVGSLG